MSPTDAESVLIDLASVFARGGSSRESEATLDDPTLPNLEARYRTLVEQLPALVFMAYLDRGIGEAYVSPRIEQAMGFSQAEWLEDPVRWYHHIHPEDRQRWSVEAATMFLTGQPLRSAYRVTARDGRVIWFQCEVKMVRRADGRPWFIHGVGFDITDLKHAEAALQEEHALLSAVLDTVGALVVVLSPGGAIVRFNRACERLSGYRFEEVWGRPLWDLLPSREEGDRFRGLLEGLRPGHRAVEFEGDWVARDGTRRRIAWSTTVLTDASAPGRIVATGIDITERKRMEKAVLEISEREQRKIGQDLHDGLGQHLTGIAFMSKVLAQQLAEDDGPQADHARKIVGLVNQAVHKTRELARGLVPVFSGDDGLASALRSWAGEVEDLFHVSCLFDCDDPIPIPDVGTATHLYHIAQEAVTNAIKHGRAGRIRLVLSQADGSGRLIIEDDGSGIPEPAPSYSGLGLHIMSYRASMVGGSLEVRRGPSGGTVVQCRFPLQS